jgi:MOSC domain-containing protein
MTTPRLSSLHIYPVKSLRGPAPVHATVEPWGLSGDRRWMLVDGAGRFVSQRSRPRLALVTAEALPDGGVRLAAPGRPDLTVPVPEPAAGVPVTVWRDTVEAVPAGGGAADWFGAFLNGDFRLVHLDDPSRRRPIDPRYALPGETVTFADGFPLLLTTTGSLDALNGLIARGEHAAEGPLPMERFRPNVVVEGTDPWAEDGWRRIRIGEVGFRVAKPCARCLITTTDQLSAERGREPLHTLARHRRRELGVIFGQNLVPESTGTLSLGDPLSVAEWITD